MSMNLSNKFYDSKPRHTLSHLNDHFISSVILDCVKDTTKDIYRCSARQMVRVMQPGE